jgi:hypothetical protein
MRKIACFFVLLVLVMQSVFAISTNLNSSYLQGETAISEISGNILEPITASDVEFKRGHVLVPFDYDLDKIGEKYYIWFITPESEMNYTLIIKNITTTVSGQIKQINYEKNFTVLGNLSDYWVKPGFISTERDFEIKAQLNEDNDKSIIIKLIEESNFTLKPGKNTIKFSISEINETKTISLIVGKYTIPAYIKINKTKTAGGIINPNLLNLTNISETDFEELPAEEQKAINKERAKYNCSEYPGSICAADEICSGETIVSADGPCCVGIGAVCAKEEAGSSMAWIGYLLGAIVIIGGIFLWIRYRKVKAEKNPIEKKVQLLEKKAH